MDRGFRGVLLEDAARLLDGGPSFLETAAVGLATAKDYKRRKDMFLQAASISDLLGCPLDELERALLEHFDTIYLDGKDVSHGAKLLSALAYFRPQLRGLTRSGLLARARLALQGWTRLAPTGTRLPLPWPVLAALAVVLMHMARYDAALATILAGDAYLRPGECLWLASEDVAPAQPQLGETFRWTSLLLFPRERGKPSKTLGYDDSVVLDSKGREWLGPLVEAQARRRPHQQLFGMTYLDWLNLVKTAAATLGLQDWDITLYRMRHTGPSHDWLAQLRSLSAIQRRGRWGAASSVRRYEKSARVTSLLGKLPPEILEFAKVADQGLGDFLARKRALPTLPIVRPAKRLKKT